MRTENFYAECRAAVLGTLIRNGTSRHDAEDALQEAFTQYPETRDVGLIVTAARGAEAKRHRRTQTIKFVSLTGNEEDPIDAIDQVEKRIMLRNAIDRLPKPQRAAFILIAMRGWTQKEVAERTGQSQQNVALLYADAKERLRFRLRDIIQ